LPKLNQPVPVMEAGRLSPPTITHLGADRLSPPTTPNSGVDRLSPPI